jgi:hypothetical protein
MFGKAGTDELNALSARESRSLARVVNYNNVKFVNDQCCASDDVEVAQRDWVERTRVNSNL